MQNSTRSLVMILAAEPHHADAWTAELRRAGLEPFRPHMATEADFLARVEAGVDAILAPLDTSEFGALQALNRLHERGLNIPLIAVSDAPDWAAAVAVMKAGAADCVEPTRLGPALREALVRRAPADDTRAEDDPGAMLHALLETTLDIVIFKDCNHIFRACSRAKGEQSGLMVEEMIGKSDYDLFSPAQAEQFQAEELVVMSTGQAVVAEHLLDTPRGPRWYEAIKTPVRDARGEVVGVLCTERDITDRKGKEDALRESERRLKRLQEALVELTASAALNHGLVADACREVVEVSARCLEVEQVSVWNLTDDHMLRCLDLYELSEDRHAPGPAVDLAKYPGYLRALLEDRVIAAHDARVDPVTREMRASHLEPRNIGALLDAPIRVNGRTVGVVCHTQLGAPRSWTPEEQAFAGSLADMLSLVMERVNRRQIEAERDEQRRMLRAVLDTLPDFILFKDCASVFRVVNRAFADFVGRSEAEMLGQSDRTIFAGPEAERYAAEEQQVMDTGRTVVNEHLLTGAHGVRWDEAIKTPLRDENGRIIGVLIAGRDVTARKVAEAERDEQRRMLRAVLDTTPDRIVFKDRSFVWRVVNESCARYWERTVESMIGLTDFDLYDAETAQQFRAEETRILETGETMLIERLHETVHGPRWLEVVKTPLRDDGGRIIGILNVARDVTERKQAEAELHAQRRMLRTVLDTNPDRIIFKDRDFVFRTANLACARAWGRTPEDLVGLTDFDLWPAEVAAEMRSGEERVMATREPLVGEFLRPTALGPRWHEIIKTPVCNEQGEVLGVLVNIRDVTERKQAEAERDEQRRLLRGVLDTTPDYIAFKDRELIYRVVNQSYCHFYHRPMAEIIGITDRELWPRELADEFRVEELRIMATGEVVRAERLRPTVDGPRWLDVRKTRMCDDQGNVLGVLANVRDITDRKHAEAERDEQRRLLRAVLDTTPDMVIFKDRDSVWRMLNESCARHWSCTVDSMIGLNDFDLWPAEAQRFRDEEVRVMETGIPVVAEDLHDTAFGPRWLEAIKTRVCDDTGAVLGVLVNVRDVTDRRRAQDTLARRAREMTALYETSLAINAQRDIPTLLQSIVAHAVELIGSDLGEMYLMRADGQTLDMAGSYNLPDEFVKPVMRVGEGLTGHTARAGEPLALEDYCTWSGRACAGPGLHRTLSVPLKRGDQVIGVINVFDMEQVGPFEEDEIRLVKLFADQATIALENARLYEAAQRELAERIRAEAAVARRAREMTALYETSLAINAQRDIPSLLQSIVQRAVELMGAGVGEVHLMTADRLTLELAGSFNLPPNYAIVVVPIGRGLTGTVAQTGEPMVVEDYCRWEGRLYHENNLHRALGIPLKSGGRVIGVINVFDTVQTGPFDEDEIRLVKLFADQATIALENARLYEAAQRELAERVRVETDLRRERDFNAGILATTEMAISVLDAQGRIVLFNRKCQEISGYSEEEALGRVTWDFLIPPEDVERVKQALGSWPKREPPAYYENPWLTRDGRRVPLIWRNAALRDPDNGQTLFIGSGIDISERVAREREIERRNRELTLLYETLRAAGASLDPNEVYPRVVSALAEVGGYPVVVVRVPKGDRLVVCAAESYPEFKREMVADIGIHGRVMRTGEPVFAPDVAQEPDYVAWRSEITGQICVPVKVDGEIVALLNIESDAARPLTDDDFRLALTVAGQLGLMMNNAALYDRLQTERDRVQGFNEQLLALQRVATAVSSHLDQRELLDTIAAAGAELLYADSAAILFPDDHDALTIRGSYGLQPDTVRDTKLPMGAGIAGLASQTGEAVIVADVQTDPRFALTRNSEAEGFRSMISTPLWVGKSVIGTLNVQSHQRTHAFNADHARILALLANQAAAAIANARLYAITTESETRYRSLFERSLDGIVLVDAQTGAITDANPAFQALVGYSLADLLRRRFWDIQPQDYREAMRRRMLVDYRDEGRPVAGSTRFLTSDDRMVDAEFTTWMVEVGGQTFGVAAIRDVTDRLQLEDQLRQAQKMEAIGTLAGGIAHDFNNILGAILGYASFIKNGLQPGDPLRADAETVERSALRGAELTRQLLAFARDGRSYELKPVNLNSAITETVQLLARTVDKSIAIRPEMEPRLPFIEADAGQIQQLLLNLCLNACEAMAGGGFLTVETKVIRLDAERALRELNKPAGTYIRLSVTDTGHGMDAETLERIFVPFFSTKKDQPGRKHSGLGLAVVFGIVKGHDGVIRVESAVGRGTTFRIWLPAQADSGPVDSAAPAAPAARGSETILVVDDEESLRDILERVLGGAGYRVLSAANGADGLELFRVHVAQTRLVILDMIMPGLSGFKVFQMMKQLDPQVCVLISSGYSEQGEAHELLAAGAKGFIQKPFMFQDILTKVRTVLDEECRKPG